MDGSLQKQYQYYSSLYCGRQYYAVAEPGFILYKSTY